jgi:hypothetical protein
VVERALDPRLQRHEAFLGRLHAQRLARRAIDLADEGRGGYGEGVADDARQPFVVLAFKGVPGRRCPDRPSRSLFHFARQSSVSANGSAQPHETDEARPSSIEERSLGGSPRIFASLF